MTSFFFIPATKLDKINNIKKKVDEVIIDFEDGIKDNEREKLQLEVNKISGFQDFWYRIPVRNDTNEDELNLELLVSFLELGITKIVLPKIMSKQEVKLICSALKGFLNFEFILLIEHPRILLEIPQIFRSKRLSSHITGIGLGSHDFMAFMELPHLLDNLKFLRQQIILIAKAYGKLAIDIASMDIKNKNLFEEELVSGYNMGFKNKFIIHPQQLQWLQGYEEKNSEQSWAERILASLPTNYDGEPFVLNGEIIEKPHVKKALKILNK